MTEIADALRDTLLALTRIPSPIGEEAELCDHVEARLSGSLGGDAISRFHDSLIVRAAQRPNAPRIALVGHLDTVRTQHDGPPRVEGNLLYGAGAADMKSGLAIMIELVERLDLAVLPCDLTLIFHIHDGMLINEPTSRSGEIQPPPGRIEPAVVRPINVNRGFESEVLIGESHALELPHSKEYICIGIVPPVYDEKVNILQCCRMSCGFILPVARGDSNDRPDGKVVVEHNCCIVRIM